MSHRRGSLRTPHHHHLAAAPAPRTSLAASRRFAAATTRGPNCSAACSAPKRSSAPTAADRVGCSPSSPIRRSCRRSSRTSVSRRNRPLWPGPGHRRRSTRLGSSTKKAMGRDANHSQGGRSVPCSPNRPFLPISEACNPSCATDPTPPYHQRWPLPCRNRSLFHLLPTASSPAAGNFPARRRYRSTRSRIEATSFATSPSVTSSCSQNSGSPAGER